MYIIAILILVFRLFGKEKEKAIRARVQYMERVAGDEPSLEEINRGDTAIKTERIIDNE